MRSGLSEVERSQGRLHLLIDVMAGGGLHSAMTLSIGWSWKTAKTGCAGRCSAGHLTRRRSVWKFGKPARVGVAGWISDRCLAWSIMSETLDIDGCVHHVCWDPIAIGDAQVLIVPAPASKLGKRADERWARATPSILAPAGASLNAEETSTPFLTSIKCKESNTRSSKMGILKQGEKVDAPLGLSLDEMSGHWSL